MSRGFPKILEKFTHPAIVFFPWRFYGDSMEIMWRSYGDYVEILCRFCVLSMKIVWRYYVDSMEILCRFSPREVVKIMCRRWTSRLAVWYNGISKGKEEKGQCNEVYQVHGALLSVVRQDGREAKRTPVRMGRRLCGVRSAHRAHRPVPACGLGGAP